MRKKPWVRGLGGKALAAGAEPMLDKLQALLGLISQTPSRSSL